MGGLLEEHEKECARIREDNDALLEEFDQWLSSKGLTESTVDRHCDNVEFYVNEYLLYERPQPAKEGVFSVGLFLGDWFIRKTTWASQTAIKENARSLKKFYAFMVHKGEVRQEDLDSLNKEIRDEMSEWLKAAGGGRDSGIDGMWDL